MNIHNLKIQEELSSVVKERQRLRESERILVQTFDTLKNYYEKPQVAIDCAKCGLSCINEAELKMHRETAHGQVQTCITCNFVSNSKTVFEEHLKTHTVSCGGSH